MKRTAPFLIFLCACTFLVSWCFSPKAAGLHTEELPPAAVVSNTDGGILSKQVNTTHKLYDFAGLLSKKKAQELSERLHSASKTMDLVILTTNDTSGLSSEDFANQFYDRNHFGVGSQNNGILLLIDMDNRNVWISTTGEAAERFSPQKIDAMLDTITPYLSKGDYSGACEQFLSLSVGKTFFSYLSPGQLVFSAVAALLVLLWAFYTQRRENRASPASGAGKYYLKQEDLFTVGQKRNLLSYQMRYSTPSEAASSYRSTRSSSTNWETLRQQREREWEREREENRKAEDFLEREDWPTLSSSRYEPADSHSPAFSRPEPARRSDSSSRRPSSSSGSRFSSTPSRTSSPKRGGSGSSSSSPKRGGGGRGF